jgi:putative ABC transport system substrate-binding protein
MQRREFLAMASAVLAPTAAWPQAPAKIPKIGFLGLAPASAWSGEVNALREGLRTLGYVEGKNLVFDFRWASDSAETRADEVIE